MSTVTQWLCGSARARVSALFPVVSGQEMKTWVSRVKQASFRLPSRTGINNAGCLW